MRPFNSPEGLRDALPYQLAHRTAIQNRIMAYIQQAGYEPVATPLLEYDAVIGSIMPASIAQQAIRLIDQNDVMILRPDHTVPIARLVGTHLSHDHLKLCYAGPIYYRDNAGNCVEKFQIGIEYIGDTQTGEADVSILTLLLNTLDQLALPPIAIDVSHVDCIKNQTHIYGISDYTTGILPRGEAALATAPDALRDVVNQCNDTRITANLGITQDSRYYTGIVFEAAIDGLGECVASGGRYDKLLGHFGASKPAIGFCITLDLLADYTESNP